MTVGIENRYRRVTRRVPNPGEAKARTAYPAQTSTANAAFIRSSDE